MRLLLPAATFALLGCASGDHDTTPLSPDDTGATPGTGASETGDDTQTQETGFIAFDDCAGRLGADVVTEKLVHADLRLPNVRARRARSGVVDQRPLEAVGRGCRKKCGGRASGKGEV